MTLKVLVAGAGLGGLCLAQGLRRAGVEVRLFERDASAHVRGQGYRLRIDEHGVAGLRRCLPPELFELFEATTNVPYPPRGIVFDHRLEQIAALAEGLGAAERKRLSTVANRRTLRQILLAGLTDAIDFGRTVIGADQTAEAVTVRFADGSTETGDVLVAADGINSVIRQQLFPSAQILDTGLRGIYGYAILDWHLRDVLPEALLRGSPRVLGPDATMAVGAYLPTESPQRAAARIAPYARLSHVPEYVKWTLVSDPVSRPPMPSGREAPADDLHGAALDAVDGWHPALVELVRCSDPASTFALSIRGALPVQAWPPSRITLLGDAIHATTPAGGPGANVALRDAALLCERLAQCLSVPLPSGAGRLDVLDAIGGYERQMRDYGFAASTRSLHGAEAAFRSRPLVPA